jgi:hypothetical protein
LASALISILDFLVGVVADPSSTSAFLFVGGMVMEIDTWWR